MKRGSHSPSKWSFARVDGGQGMDFQGKETAIVSSDIHIHLPTTFQTGWIYELIYTAKDPLVMGLGHLVSGMPLVFCVIIKPLKTHF